MANELQTKLTRSINFGAVTIGGVAITKLTDQQLGIRKTIPANSTDVQVVIGSVTMANVLAMGLEVSEEGCTVKTNSSGSPTDTILPKKNVALIWIDGDPSLSKFITAVTLTSVFVSTGGSDALFAFGLALDVTPGIT
jgi:hypothetical protein